MRGKLIEIVNKSISEGHIINKPEPLFKKIDPDMIDEELTPKKRIL